MNYLFSEYIVINLLQPFAEDHPMKRNALIYGTIILTATGVLSRFIGFFYRIFLSQIFGEVGMGIYQLSMPVFFFVFALTTAGFSLALSKEIAAHLAQNRFQQAYRTLCATLIMSVSLSVLCMIIVYCSSSIISSRLIREPLTIPLLRMMVILFPLNAIHSCVNAFYFGMKKTLVPALTQLLEQFLRVGSIALLFFYASQHGYSLTLTACVFGLIIGEAVSAAVSVFCIIVFLRKHQVSFHKLSPMENTYRVLFKLSYPVTLNRIVISLLSTLEAYLLPASLVAYGYSTTQALATYGVFTGMAIPLIYFPSALPGSASVLLLPSISEAESGNNQVRIRSLTRKSTSFTLCFGLFCCMFFFFCGDFLGRLLFSSSKASFYIKTLSFICPFTYLSTTLSGILNGLGRTRFTFLCNSSGLLIRLLFVLFAVPVFGMKGFMWGMILFHLYICLVYCLALRKYLIYNSH